jgi:hypothetical protein
MDIKIEEVYQLLGEKDVIIYNLLKQIKELNEKLTLSASSNPSPTL